MCTLNNLDMWTRQHFKTVAVILFVGIQLLLALSTSVPCSSLYHDSEFKVRHGLQEKMRTTQKQLDDLTRQVSSLLSENSQLETRTRILEQVVYLNTNHEQMLHANQAGLCCACCCQLLLLSCNRQLCSATLLSNQQHCNFLM